MKRIFLLLLLPSLFLSMCQKDKISIDPENLIIGVWNLSGYHNNSVVYSRQKDFAQIPGYKFKTDGTLTERKNSGWCGTPPVSYADYDGTWSILNDTLLQIKDGYWGGTTNYKIDIESITKDSLKIQTIWESN
jgi:hypothetical protein